MISGNMYGFGNILKQVIRISIVLPIGIVTVGILASILILCGCVLLTFLFIGAVSLAAVRSILSGWGPSPTTKVTDYTNLEQGGTHGI